MLARFPEGCKTEVKYQDQRQVYKYQYWIHYTLNKTKPGMKNSVQLLRIAHQKPNTHGTFPSKKTIHYIQWFTYANSQQQGSDPVKQPATNDKEGENVRGAFFLTVAGHKVHNHA